MKQKFADALIDAEGRSEFVIVVVADIRGFSTFSTVNESPNIAMFVKRFYLQLINKYFDSANFVKPTGDGLLMTFPYSESTLLNVSETVVNACLTCLADFPTMCARDPMINFNVPKAIGFGVARGTACCLFSGEEILDYSGHLLNLASRLNDLARPGGIVIDGGFLEAAIPESANPLFKTQKVYVRSIAEENPIEIFYLNNHVQIAESALHPLTEETWQTEVLQFTPQKLATFSSTFFWYLPYPARSKEKIKITITTPKLGMKGIKTYVHFTSFKYVEDGPKSRVDLDMDKARKLIGVDALKPLSKITFRLEYVPRGLPRN